MTKQPKQDKDRIEFNNWKEKYEEFENALIFMILHMTDSMSDLEDITKMVKKFISSELQREREKVLEEVREIIKNCYWISGNRFTVNGKQEKMIVKHELLSKINKLK